MPPFFYVVIPDKRSADPGSRIGLCGSWGPAQGREDDEEEAAIIVTPDFSSSPRRHRHRKYQTDGVRIPA